MMAVICSYIGMFAFACYGIYLKRNNDRLEREAGPTREDALLARISALEETVQRLSAPSSAAEPRRS